MCFKKTECDANAIKENANCILKNLFDKNTKFEFQPEEVKECAYFQFTTDNRFLYRLFVNLG